MILSHFGDPPVVGQVVFFIILSSIFVLFIKVSVAFRCVIQEVSRTPPGRCQEASEGARRVAQRPPRHFRDAPKTLPGRSQEPEIGLRTPQ